MPLKKINVDLPAIQGVVAGSKATLRLPPSWTYHQVPVAYSGVTLAQINAIRLMVNGEVAQTITEAAKLDSFNLFDGRAAAGGTLIIDFERFGLRDRLLQELTAIGTGLPPEQDPRSITSLYLEFDIDAAAAAPVMSAKAVVSAPRPSGYIIKRHEFPRVSSGAGLLTVSDLPLEMGQINRIFFGNHAVIGYTSFKVTKDNNVIFDRTVADNEQFQVDGVRVPQADLVAFDPSEDGFGDEWLVTDKIQNLRIDLQCGAAGAVPITVEYLAPIANVLKA